MSIAQPHFVVAQLGTDLTDTITIAGNTTDWEALYELKTAIGGVTITTKTIGAGIVNTPGSSLSTMVTTILAADIEDLAPGNYSHRLSRINAGGLFPIFDWSGFLLTSDDAYPQLTNLSEYLAHLGFPQSAGNTDAMAYLQLLAAAESIMRNKCGRQFNYATWTEYPDVDFGRTVLLRETPVNPEGLIVNYDYERQFSPTTELTYGVDYILTDLDENGWSRTGFIERIGGLWAGTFKRDYAMMAATPVTGRGILKVEYAGGYPIIPNDLKLAVWQIVAERRQARTRGAGFQSQSGMNYSYTLADLETEAMKLGSVQDAIATYRRGDSYLA